MRLDHLWLCSPLLSGVDLVRGGGCGKSKVSISKLKGMDGLSGTGSFFVAGEVAVCAAPRTGFQPRTFFFLFLLA